MNKINRLAERPGAWDSDEVAVVKPLTRDEAELLRRKHSVLSPWWVLAAQTVGGGFVSGVAWWVSGSVAAGWSALYGVAAVVIPGALFARGLMSKVSSINPAAAVTGFFLWEAVKIGLVLAMLFAAPKLVPNLNWPAMLVGLIVTMKVVWPVLWFHAKFLQKRGVNLKS